MITATVDDIMRLGPCNGYTRERVSALWAGREHLTATDISELDIPIDDRLWALSQMLYHHSPHRSNRLARRIALDVAHRWDCPDIVWRYLVTGDKTLESAAWSAAWSAAGSAAWSAAGSAAGYERYLGWFLEVM